MDEELKKKFAKSPRLLKPAPVTEYNLLSLFSDISETVFKNPKLAPQARGLAGGAERPMG